jgi:hypothetical protein
MSNEQGTISNEECGKRGERGGAEARREEKEGMTDNNY